MNLVQILQKEQEKQTVPVLRSGDTVRVHVKVVEGTRERIQVFEGIVIALKGKTGLGSSFTVRRISHGVGVERTFLVHSPRIDRIEVLRHGDVRRAKLFYLRDKVGKDARIRERRELPLGEMRQRSSAGNDSLSASVEGTGAPVAAAAGKAAEDESWDEGDSAGAEAEVQPEPAVVEP